MKMIMAAALSMLASVPAAAGTPDAASSRAELNASIERLQKSPDDSALRERIIKLAKQIKPAPAVSEEGRRHFVKATAAFKDAKSNAAYERAATEYRAALLIAPWWADAYFNLSKVDELLKRYDAAISDLKLYLQADPNAKDARALQDHIYALEEKADEAKSAPAEAPARKESNSLEGAVWLQAIYTTGKGKYMGRGFYMMRGGYLYSSSLMWKPNFPEPAPTLSEYNLQHPISLNGRRFSAQIIADGGLTEGEISEDGSTITTRDIINGEEYVTPYSRK